MPKALADSKKADRKRVEARIGKGPKHVPATPNDPTEENTCAEDAPVVQSGSIFGNIAATLTKEDPMSDNQAPKKTQAEREAETQARIAKKEAANAEKAARKAEREAAAASKKELAEAKKAERESNAAARRQANEERAAALKEAGKGYVGSMLSLADRVKQGVYVKGMNGQLRSSDELAVALEACPATNVIKLALEVLDLESNPYQNLNVGQQSMNLRNKLRGAIKAGKLTLDVIREVRDNNGYATMGAIIAERRAKAEAREQAKAEKQAAKLAKQAAKNDKQAELAV